MSEQGTTIAISQSDCVSILEKKLFNSLGLIVEENKKLQTRINELSVLLEEERGKRG